MLIMPRIYVNMSRKLIPLLGWTYNAYTAAKTPTYSYIYIGSTFWHIIRHSIYSNLDKWISFVNICECVSHRLPGPLLEDVLAENLNWIHIHDRIYIVCVLRFCMSGIMVYVTSQYHTSILALMMVTFIAYPDFIQLTKKCTTI